MEFAPALQALTDDVGIYISARLRYILQHKGGNEFPPKEISDSLVVDCEQAISVIVEAWRSNPIQVDWDIEEYIKDIGTQPTGIVLSIPGCLAFADTINRESHVNGRGVTPQISSGLSARRRGC
jgi:hypothetical protein